jgi:Camelysin metallo-endopeptidase
VNGTRIRSFLLGALAVGLIAFGSGGTYSAFSNTTANAGNAFAAGTVYLTDNDTGSAMFNVTGMRPTDAARTSCITVTYAGSLNADVEVYGTVSATGVEQYVNLKIETGSTTTGFGNCTGFTPTSTLYNDTLANLPSSWASGIADTSANPWTTGHAQAYRFTVSLQNNAAAQGKTATATFTWEARNR